MTELDIVDKSAQMLTASQLGLSSGIVEDASDFGEIYGYSEDEITDWLQAISRKGQALFYGPPGTGKTHISKHLASEIAGTDDRVEIVQFHPGYSFESFIQGIRPEFDEDAGTLKYPVVDGDFVEFCERAQRGDGRYVFVIDELNRAEVPAVLGELIYLLDARGESINLPHRDSTLCVPENLYILATMNTFDKSTSSIDTAIQRRFAQIEIRPRPEVIESYHENLDVGGLVEVLGEINSASHEGSDLGVSYFLADDLADDIESIWRYEVEPQISEMFPGHPEMLEQYSWPAVKDDIIPF